MKNATALQIEVRTATPDQMKDIYGLAIQAIPTGISFESAQAIIGNKSAFITKVQDLFPDPAILHDPLKQWEVFYREEFNETHDFSEIKIPEKRECFNRLIIVPKGMTMNRAYKACEKHFPCWRYNNDLDTRVPTNDRTPSESYAIWVRDRVEADEELKKLSANDLVDQKVGGITLLERILLELKYFRETGKHLDIKNVTLCSGSRDADGDVPNACWDGGKFGVSWDYCDYRYSCLRSREAVSL
ncbi:MAG: hypothetical protein NUV47_01915 [Patescibacteria group bacterium]|nr:hypothetical protein [Patescibacteria group bacterium]